MKFPKIPLKAVIYWIALLYAISLLFSCSPLQRLHWMEKRHPYLFNRSIDTLYIQDTFTVYIPGVKKDTAVPSEKLYDTVTIVKEQLTVKVWRDRGTDTVYIAGECAPVEKEIIRDIKIPYTKNETYHKARDKLSWGWWVMIITVALYLAYKGYKKIQIQKQKKSD